MSGIGIGEIRLNHGIGMGHQSVKHFFRAFKAQIGAAEGQKRNDRPWKQGGQQQGHRQQDQELVAKGPHGDAPDDRQFTLCRKARGIGGGDGRVIDHHTRRLGPGLGRCPHDIIDRSGRHLGNRCHIIQQRQQSAHTLPLHCLGLSRGPAPGLQSAALDLMAFSRRPWAKRGRFWVKDHVYLFVWGLIVLAIVGDVALNHARVALFLIHEIMQLQEYLQFWR